MKAADIEPALRSFLAKQLGTERFSIEGFRSMTGGATREVWQLDLVREPDGAAPPASSTREELVLLCFRPFGQRSFSPANEYRLIEAAGRVGVPVPRTFLMGDDSLGQPFYLTARVAGETIGRRIVREESLAGARAVLATQLGEALAAIHRLPVGEGSGLEFLPSPPIGRAVVDCDLENLESVYRQTTVEPHPAFELAFRWLAQHRPPASQRALVHGDFRIGNVVVGEEGLRCVLDWELAHVGDPLEDLGWMCVRSWRFGRGDLPVGGIGQRRNFYEAYERASGRPVDAAQVHFWEVYGNLRWGVFTLVQLRGFLDGFSRSVELATIGRRTAETEVELLDLMEKGGA